MISRRWFYSAVVLSSACLVLAAVFVVMVAFASNARNASVEQHYNAEEQQTQYGQNEVRFGTPDSATDAVPGSAAEEDGREQDRPDGGAFPWTEIEVERNNEMARTNPAIGKILMPGEGESVLLENVKNIKCLSSLDPANIEQSLRYIGDFLSERGHAPGTVAITILYGIETVPEDRYKLFFFQVDGEDAVYSVSLRDPEYCWTVGVRDTADERWLLTTTKEYKDILRRRGYL